MSSEHRVGIARAACAFAAAGIVWGIAAVCAAASEVRVGVHDAAFEWAPVPQDVAGYLVWVKRFGEPARAENFVTEPRARIAGAFGDSVTVSVQAVAFDGSAYKTGPMSESSEPLRFLAPPAFRGTPSVLLSCAACARIEARSLVDGEAIESGTGMPEGWRLVDVADHDGDGDDDVLWRASDGQLLLYWLDGLTPLGGSSASGADLRFEQAYGAGDFDGDGERELVTHRRRDGMIRFWHADRGAYRPFAELPDLTSGLIVATGDFDGDGLDDVMWQNAWPRTLELWSLPGLEPQVRALAPEPPTSWNVVASDDFDGDGDPDLLWRDYDGTLTIWYLEDTVLAREAPLAALAEDAAQRVVGTADFDGDGRADIVVRHQDTGRLTAVFAAGETTPARVTLLDPGSAWTWAAPW